MLRLLPLALLVGCATSASKDSPPSYLFVQNAQSAVLKDGRLTLEGLASHAVVFSDRPAREAGYLSNASLLRAWEGADASFAKQPPNATLSLFGGEQVVDVVVVLRNPRRKGKSLSYDVEVLGGPKTASGGPVALFIDNLAPWPAVRHGMHDEPNVVVRNGMHQVR